MIQYDRHRRRFAVALAALAGCVDAIGFLSADGYFVSFMSGNTTRLGVALGTAPAHALAPALLIAGFVGGVTGGSLLTTAVELAWRIERVSVKAALVPAVLVAARDTAKTPKAVGVPEIRPVDGLTARPAGRPVALNDVGEFVAVIV